jgi:long-chain acyl-CoA synthetase
MNIANMLELQAFRLSQKSALVFDEKVYSYGMINTRANGVANGLLSLGIRKGDHVAIWLPNCLEFVTTFYGILKIGAVALPMNVLFKAREMEFLLSNSASRAIVTHKEGLPILNEIRPGLPGLKQVIATGCHAPYPGLLSFEEVMARGSGEFRSVDMTPDETATILYTSGTTGNPKGAMLTHLNLFLNSEYYASGLGARENWVGLCVLPLSHLLSLAAGLLVLFGRGATMHVMRQFDPEEMARIIQRREINYTFAVPTVYTMLLALPHDPEFDMHTLEACVITGATTPLELRRSVEDQFGCRTFQAYGQVEASPVISLDRNDLERKFESVGYPLPHVEVKIVDDHDRTLPPLEHGEICAKGHCVMKSYWNNPEGTRAAIKDGWLHTGDIGMLDEKGYLYIFDRKKDMLICGGYNIYPIELEEVLYEHPTVLEAAVVGVPDERLGEIPKAYVVLKPGMKAAEKEIMDYVKTRLAKYKKLRAVEFVDALPKGPTGKILRRLLRDRGALETHPAA